jgi:hypothetical protein
MSKHIKYGAPSFTQTKKSFEHPQLTKKGQVGYPAGRLISPGYKQQHKCAKVWANYELFATSIKEGLSALLALAWLASPCLTADCCCGCHC